MKQNKHKNNQLTKQTNPSQPVELTFLEHLYELRNRLFWVLLTLVITSAIGFQYKDQLIAAVMAPLKGEKLVYLTPGGGFSFIFTVSIYFGLLLTIPAIVYHIFKFMQPLMRNNSRSFIAKLIGLSGLLAATGVAFGYIIAVPAAINFLTTFAGDAVSPNLTADSYLSFVVTYMFGLAALFQIPLLLFIFDYVRPFPPGVLTQMQQYVVLGAAIVSAIITPTPDAVNMAIIAVPMIAVYELGVVAVFIRHRITRSADKKALRAMVMPETPDEVLTAVIEQEGPDIGVGPTMPEPAKEPLRTEPSIVAADVAVPIKPMAAKRSIDFKPVDFKPAPSRMAPSNVISKQQSPTPVPAAQVAPQRRTLDGFSSSARKSFQGTAPKMHRPVQQVRTVQPVHSVRMAPAPSAPRLRPIRSLDGFSMG